MANIITMVMNPLMSFFFHFNFPPTVIYFPSTLYTNQHAVFFQNGTIYYMTIFYFQFSFYEITCPGMI